MKKMTDSEDSVLKLLFLLLLVPAVTTLSLFDEMALTAAFTALGHDEVIVYGEAYGGSQQKQA